jgi:hypothetical protein
VLMVGVLLLPHLSNLLQRRQTCCLVLFA